MEIYDQIGNEYSKLRIPDKRIESLIHNEIGSCQNIINIGAGSGSYEPKNYNIVAVEPSKIMISQRPIGSAPVIQAYAEYLPFSDKQFDLAMALLTIHHWEDLEKGLMEMKRVSKRQLIFTWDPTFTGFWLTKDYFPEILKIDKKIFPQINFIESVLGPLKRQIVEIPHNCTDGFGSAYWRRPKAYLNPNVRAAISTFHKITNVESGLSRLRDDIESGKWEAQNGHLLELESLDLGFLILSN
jgi:SAM-dependent methyltransferase